MKKEVVVVPDNVYNPTGPIAHAQAVKVGNMVYVAGQAALDRDGNMVGRGDVDAQIELTFKNLKGVLEAAGSSLENVVQVTHFSTSLEDCLKLRLARTKYLGTDIASTGVVVKNLGDAERPLLVEINAIAIIN